MGNLIQVEIKMSNWIMEKFFQCHELVEISIPFCWIIHAVLPFIIFDGIELFQQGKMSKVIYFANALIPKNPALPARAERIDPVEWRGH